MNNNKKPANPILIALYTTIGYILAVMYVFQGEPMGVDERAGAVVLWLLAVGVSIMFTGLYNSEID